MKLLTTIFLFQLLLLTGCGKDEEIIPTHPPAQETVKTPPENTGDEIKPTEDGEADIFHYGEYNGIPYRILLPREYDSAGQYPLHIFLHGMGERGNENEKQLTIGAAHFLADSIREKYKAIVVYPQCPVTSFWFDESITEKLKTLVDILRRQYGVDDDKISIGGFSMGAYGTFEMVARYPGLFEAAVAISGAGDEEDASLMAKSRWQIFAGEKDEIVPSIRTEKIVAALQKSGAVVAFTLYPDAPHESIWMHALSEPGLFKWLFPIQDETSSGHSTSD